MSVKTRLLSVSVGSFLWACDRESIAEESVFKGCPFLKPLPLRVTMCKIGTLYIVLPGSKERNRCRNLARRTR